MSLWRDIDGAFVRTAASKAEAIRKGLRKSVDANDIIRIWKQSHPTPDNVTANSARAWAQVNIIPDSRTLNEALAPVYAAGWVLGEQAALSATARQQLRKAAPTETPLTYALSIDWKKWKPGNAAAAELVKPKGGLQKLLDNRGVVIKEINKTTLNRIGTILADGLAKGLGDSVIAKGIELVLADPRRALAIANTEMNAAMSQASMKTYNDLSVENVEWLVIEPCDICAENEDIIVPIGQPFPTGDTEPPAHPNCRCSIAPVVDEGPDNFSLGLEDFGIELSASISKGVPGPIEVETALSRLAILPNPNDPTLDEPEKFVESPWAVVDHPTIDPAIWSDAELAVIRLDELIGTDPFLNRKNLKKHIQAMGQAITPYRSLALVIEKDGNSIIIDGHHRLMAQWLLGQDKAPVWLATATIETPTEKD